MTPAEIKLLRTISKRGEKNCHGREGRIAEDLAIKGLLTEKSPGVYILTPQGQKWLEK